jgi:hypothetical protein
MKAKMAAAVVGILFGLFTLLVILQAMGIV